MTVRTRRRAAAVLWAAVAVMGAAIAGLALMPEPLWAVVVLAQDLAGSVHNALPRDVFDFGVFLIGAALFILALAKSWTMLRAAPVDNSDARLMEKMQDMVAAVARHTDGTVALMEKISEAIDRHDQYVREKVPQQNSELLRALTQQFAPLLVNAVRVAFDAERTAQVARRDRSG